MRMACPPAGMNVKRAEHAADGTAAALCAGAPTCCMQEWHMPHACPMRAPYWRAWKCACIDVGVGGDADGMSTCGHECEEGRTCCGRPADALCRPHVHVVCRNGTCRMRALCVPRTGVHGNAHASMLGLAGMRMACPPAGMNVNVCAFAPRVVGGRVHPRALSMNVNARAFVPVVVCATHAPVPVPVALWQR